MSAKLSRKPDQLALVGVPASAAAPAAGVEAAPGALRAAGIAQRLHEVGYHVDDAGDLPAQVPAPDPENPRARNLQGVLATLDPLKLRVELMAKARELPLLLGGDTTLVLALVAGLRRQAPSLGLIYISRHADLHTPQDTEDGWVEPMTVSHLVGQGAAEMVRFWKDPPLVREPDLALFGLGGCDAIDARRLPRIAVRRFLREDIRRQGVGVAARTALERVRGDRRDFVVHFSVDAISREDFPACDRSDSDGLRLAEAREALEGFARAEKFAGLSVSGYNPALDTEGRSAAVLVDLVVQALAARHAALLRPAVEPAKPEPAALAPAGAAEAVEAAPAPEPEPLRGSSESQQEQEVEAAAPPAAEVQTQDEEQQVAGLESTTEDAAPGAANSGDGQAETGDVEAASSASAASSESEPKEG